MLSGYGAHDTSKKSSHNVILEEMEKMRWIKVTWRIVIQDGERLFIHVMSILLRLGAFTIRLSAIDKT
ncbi:MAG: hypothetical protein ACRCUX_00030 [Beijerinckiaceae bacterium]